MPSWAEFTAIHVTGDGDTLEQWKTKVAEVKDEDMVDSVVWNTELCGRGMLGDRKNETQAFDIDEHGKALIGGGSGHNLFLVMYNHVRNIVKDADATVIIPKQMEPYMHQICTELSALGGIDVSNVIGCFKSKLFMKRLTLCAVAASRLPISPELQTDLKTQGRLRKSSSHST